MPRGEPRIAVLAVHGVADQQPFESARQIAALLGRLVPETSDPSCYTPFVEHTIDLPVRPVRPRTPRGTLAQAAETDTDEPIDLRFMDGLLEGYTVDGDATFQTLRLEAARRPAADAPAANVHIYEMYWADLSRLGGGFVRVFSELYQLLLHLGSLGNHVASSAVGDDRSRAARVFKWAESRATWMLAGPIALLNLFMLAPAALVLGGILGGWQRPVAVALTCASALVPAGLFGLRRRWPWPLSLLMMAAVLAVALLVSTLAGSGSARFFGFVLLTDVILFLAFVSTRYERYRPRVLPVAAVGLLAAGIAGGVSLWFEPPDQALLVRAGFRIVEVLYVLLRLTWTAFIALLWAAALGGLIFWRRHRRDQVKRALWTAVLAPSLAAYSFLVTTILLWTVIRLAVGEDRLPQATYETWRIAQPWLGRWVDTCHFVEDVLRRAAGSGFLVMLPLLGAATITAAWALGPIVWSEIQPPRHDRRAGDLGRWLNNAFPLLNTAGTLVFVAFAVVLPLGELLDWTLGRPGVLNVWLQLAGIEAGLDPDTVTNIFAAAAALIVAPAAGLVVLRGRLDALTAGFRAPLDVALDVDHYLREHPRSETPRARLCARYWSLLDHIAAAAPAYDTLVIVAHSQGTVLTADLLRYLRHRPALALDLPPVVLFTMGSPLRQLYGARFPHLYAWAYHPQPRPSARGDRIGDEQEPRPSELGVIRWVNAYRSGDYVGRWLWRADRCENQFEAAAARPTEWRPAVGLHREVEASDSAGTRREFCIGAGAHTHYWDGTAPEIAVELDALIVDAARARGASAR